MSGALMSESERHLISHCRLYRKLGNSNNSKSKQRSKVNSFFYSFFCNNRSNGWMGVQSSSKIPGCTHVSVNQESRGVKVHTVSVKCEVSTTVLIARIGCQKGVSLCLP